MPTLRKLLFLKGQFWFHISVFIFLFTALLAVKISLHHFANTINNAVLYDGASANQVAQMSNYVISILMKVVTVLFVSIAIIVAMISAIIQHRAIARAISPIAELAEKIESAAAEMNSSAFNSFVSKLESKSEATYETRTLITAFNHLGELLNRYWRESTRNEVMKRNLRFSA